MFRLRSLGNLLVYECSELIAELGMSLSANTHAGDARSSLKYSLLYRTTKGKHASDPSRKMFRLVKSIRVHLPFEACGAYIHFQFFCCIALVWFLFSWQGSLCGRSQKVTSDVSNKQFEDKYKRCSSFFTTRIHSKSCSLANSLGDHHGHDETLLVMIESTYMHVKSALRNTFYQSVFSFKIRYGSSNQYPLDSSPRWAG